MIKRQESKFRVKFTEDSRKDKDKDQDKMSKSEASEFRSNTEAHQSSAKVFSPELTSSESEKSETTAFLKQHKFKNTLQRMQYLKMPSVSTILQSIAVLGQFFQYPVSFKLLFRASNHNFSVKEFHQICDEYENTLVLCLTQDNKVIGGYTPLTWEDKFDQNRTHFKTDFKNATFLFSVSSKEKYPLIKALKNKAICCFKAYGPTFGGGYDLSIGDQANDSPNAVSYFPRNFAHPNMNGGNKRDFTGTSRKNFKLIQWQIFQVAEMGSRMTMERVQDKSFLEQKVESGGTLQGMKSMVVRMLDRFLGKKQSS